MRPPRKFVRLDASQKQVGVADGDLLAAAIANRTRVGAGALWSDAQRSRAVEVRDRSAARSDRMNVQHRYANGEVTQL